MDISDIELATVTVTAKCFSCRGSGTVRNKSLFNQEEACWRCAGTKVETMEITIKELFDIFISKLKI
jgi:hypothetical protein